MSISELYSFVKKNKLDLIEVAIEQHSVLQDIYSKSLNTIRIITIIDEHNTVQILGAMLRIGTRGVVDNFSANGVSAAIDLQNGIVEIYWSAGIFELHMMKANTLLPRKKSQVFNCLFGKI